MGKGERFVQFSASSSVVPATTRIVSVQLGRQSSAKLWELLRLSSEEKAYGTRYLQIDSVDEKWRVAALLVHPDHR